MAKIWTLYCLYPLFWDIGPLFWALLEVQVYSLIKLYIGLSRQQVFIRQVLGATAKQTAPRRKGTPVGGSSGSGGQTLPSGCVSKLGGLS